MESKVYTDMIADGEVTKDMIFDFFHISGLTPYDKLDALEVKVSNGLSGVFLYEDKAYQVFQKAIVATRVSELFKSINTNIIHDVDLGFDDFIKVPYNLSEYIPRVHNVNGNCIVWERITSLNSYSKSEITSIIEKNILKLLWDIGKALTGLHKNGIFHGDARIDNIGIKGDNFVLFDFDSSKKSYTFRNDFSIFAQSLCYNMGDDYEKIEQFIPEESCNFLERIAEQLDIDVLNSMKIKY